MVETKDEAAGKEVKLNIKIMVDSMAEKVVFAEVGKDFVDFIFHVLSLPLAIVVKLLNGAEMPGSLPSLYKSVESLKCEYFEKDLNKDSVLKPKVRINLPLLSLSDAPTTLRYFGCRTDGYWSDRKGAFCPAPYCRVALSESRLSYVAPKVVEETNQVNETLGYVREAVPYMVMDNLEVKPMSVSAVKSHVEDFDHLDEKYVEFGMKEGLALLKASLETSDVLTSVFLGQISKARKVS